MRPSIVDLVKRVVRRENGRWIRIGWDGEDLEQALFLRFLEHEVKNGKEPDPLRWLTRKARDLVVDSLRSDRRQRELRENPIRVGQGKAGMRAVNRQPEWYESRVGRVRCCRNPMIWEITVKPSQHGSGINETEDREIGKIDSHRRSMKSRA